MNTRLFFICLLWVPLAPASTHRETATFVALALGGEVLTLEGESMEPAWSPGDLAVVVPVDWEQLQVGDRIVFEVGEELWAHEVAVKKGLKVLTFGLNNGRPDAFWTERRHVKGRIEAVFRSQKSEIRNQKGADEWTRKP